MTSEPTNYHEHTDHFRRDLLKAATGWQATCNDLMKGAPVPGPERPLDEVPDPRLVAVATAASAMAANYAYTLAAIIGVAKRDYGTEIGDHLAFEADEILTNGDFDDTNADVTPAPEQSADDSDG